MGSARSFIPICFSIVFILFLASCASSNVSREAASNVDLGVQNAKNLADNVGDLNIADTYQNSSQTTKGVLLGGAAGGVAGALTSGVGVLPGTAVGAIMGGSYGAYIDSNTTLKDRLENRGVTMIVLGDQVLIILPSSRIFDYNSASIKKQAYSTLKLVAQYINQYTKMLVKVSGYTDNSGADNVDLSLSKQQAEAVAKVLLADGVDARVLYADGYGSSRLVSKSDLDWDSDNYRVEITLEKLYV